jgi:hypothetical protein
VAKQRITSAEYLAISDPKQNKNTARLLPGWLRQKFGRACLPSGLGAVIGWGLEGYVYALGQKRACKILSIGAPKAAELERLLNYVSLVKPHAVVPVESWHKVGNLETPRGAPLPVYCYVAERLRARASWPECEAVQAELKALGFRVKDGLSPDNVMKDADGRARCIDLGEHLIAPR